MPNAGQHKKAATIQKDVRSSAARQGQRVAKPVVKEEEGFELIAAEPAQVAVDAVMSDPLAVYLWKSNALFQERVLTPLGTISKSVCVFRDAKDIFKNRSFLKPFFHRVGLVLERAWGGFGKF